ncbi:MAG: hypothetical protein ACKOHK_14700, partial [Planctomycetia bacterium]
AAQGAAPPRHGERNSMNDGRRQLFAPPKQLLQPGAAVSLPEPEHGPARAGDLRSNLVDATLAGRVLGWRPAVAIDEGLALTAEWFAAHAAG